MDNEQTDIVFTQVSVFLKYFIIIILNHCIITFFIALLLTTNTYGVISEFTGCSVMNFIKH